jgi:hypothetical protein
MNESIIHFLQKQSCASICCVNATGAPFCFSCFYAFDNAEALLCFKSSPATHHAQLMKVNPQVAGTVLPDKLNKLLIKGIQFEGVIVPAYDPLAEKGNRCYLQSHPLSIAIPGEIWTIQINAIKLTDSSKVLGRKTRWARNEQEV